MPRTQKNGTYITRRGTKVPFAVRYSSRIRHERVRVNSRGQVEVVLRPGSWTDPLDFLASADDWVERAMSKTEAGRANYLATVQIPKRIEFPVSNEVWDVELHETNSTRITARADADLGVLRLSGAVGDEDAVRRALRRFVKLRADDVLVRLLELVSTDAGIPYSSSRTTYAKSRWGSCSAKREIMLSTRIMFLPQPLAIHVCLHELCHVVHLDHSPAFHALLEKLDPQAREHAAALKLADVLVPAWMDEGK